MGFLLLGLLISWIISGIAALLVTDKRPQKVELAQPQASSQSVHLTELEKATELRDAGSLTDDEFAAEKARILGHSQ